MGLFSLVEADLGRVEAILERALRADNQLVASVADYLLMASGKRLRPALVLLAGQFGEPAPDRADRLVQVAAGVEMIHMATLIHDDIIDDAALRRGLPAVRSRFTNSVAVLTGDFLFALSIQLFARLKDTELVEVAAHLVHVMCVGEIAQNLGQGDIGTEAEYWRRIEAKTGYFLETSCRLGAMAAGVPAPVLEALAQYGHHIGLAYQVVDDLLDWVADPEKLGKAVGGDLAAGIFTLPVIYALGQPEPAGRLKTLLAGEDLPRRVPQVRRVLEQSGALEYARSQAQWHVAEAVRYTGMLPAGTTRDALRHLAEFVVARDF